MLREARTEAWDQARRDTLCWRPTCNVTLRTRDAGLKKKETNKRLTKQLPYSEECRTIRRCYPPSKIKAFCLELQRLPFNMPQLLHAARIMT